MNQEKMDKYKSLGYGTKTTQRILIYQILSCEGMVMTSEVLDRLQHKGLDLDCFTDDLCRKVYEALIGMQTKVDGSFDYTALMTEFETNDALEFNDLMDASELYVNEGVESMPNVSPWDNFYVDAILEMKKQRQIVRASRLAMEQISEGICTHEVISDLQKELNKTSELVSEEKSIDSCVDDFVTSLFAEPEAGDYIPTGIKGLDEDLNGHGYGKNQLCVLAARPGCGKTAFALNVAHRAVSKGIPVGIMSLEMETADLMGRMLSIDGKVQMARFKDGVANSQDQQRLKKAVENSKKWPIYIKDDAYDLNYLLACAKNMHRRHDIKLLVVDYCQLIKSHLKLPRNEQVANISRELKLLAKSLKIPVLLLCQMNREIAKEDRVPRATDLGESGALERDADSITFLFLGKEDDPNGQMVRYVMCKQRAGKGYSIGQTAFIRQIQYMGDI